MLFGLRAPQQCRLGKPLVMDAAANGVAEEKDDEHGIDQQDVLYCDALTCPERFPMDTSDPTNPVGFRAWTDETVRFADLDPLGHAANTAFNVYFGVRARATLFAEAGALEQNGQSVVIARLTIDFRTELNYGDQSRIGTGC